MTAELNPTTIFLPAAILQQDAVVIDEQENHVVMTLRLPIDVIRDNQTTLMALIEIATGKKLRLLDEPEEGDLDEEGGKTRLLLERKNRHDGALRWRAFCRFRAMSIKRRHGASALFHSGRWVWC